MLIHEPLTRYLLPYLLGRAYIKFQNQPPLILTATFAEKG